LQGFPIIRSEELWNEGADLMGEYFVKTMTEKVCLPDYVFAEITSEILASFGEGDTNVMWTQHSNI